MKKNYNDFTTKLREAEEALRKFANTIRLSAYGIRTYGMSTIIRGMEAQERKKAK